MRSEEIKALLSDPRSASEKNFEILKAISERVNRPDKHDEGRDLIIRVLSVIESFEKATHEIIFALVRSTGLFPYLTGNLECLSADDRLAYELHRSSELGGEVIFHSLQARIFNQLIAGSNVVLSASTSVGKSLIIDAVVAAGKFRKIVIIVPTIALIDEARRRLSKRFGHAWTIVTHPSQSERSGFNTLYILTQERVLQRSDMDDAELLIVDEFYKMNIKKGDVDERAIDLNLAFHRIARTGCQFYLLGPNIQSLSGLGRYEYHFIPSEFSTVSVDVILNNLPCKGDQRIQELGNLFRSVDGPTIIYCQSPKSVSNVANFLVDQVGLERDVEMAEAAEWISANYNPDWIVSRALNFGIGLHHGGVPRSLQQLFIRLFNERKIRFLICTSTIIEGVNTVAKNVIIYDRRTGRNAVIDHFTYKNIRGRAGRMREYYVGKVHVLEEPPDEDDYTVEMPIGAQCADTPVGLLLDLDDDSLTKESKKRLEDIFESSGISSETLRKNRYMPIEAQEKVARAIREDLYKYEDVLAWKGFPSAAQLNAVCNLVFDWLSDAFLKGYGVFSGDSFAWHVNSLRMGGVVGYLKDRISGKKDEEKVSEVIEASLKFIRNVMCQRFPRDLMIIQHIHAEVFIEKGMEPGNYSVFAERAENMFIDPFVFALEEFGLPFQIGESLSPLLLPSKNLDEILRKLKDINADVALRIPFEQHVLRCVQDGIFLPDNSMGSSMGSDLAD